MGKFGKKKFLATEPPSSEENGPRKNEPEHKLLIFEYPAFADKRSDLIG